MATKKKEPKIRKRTKKKELKIRKRNPEPLRLQQIAFSDEGNLFGLDLDGYVWRRNFGKWIPVSMEIA
jgi:hypothetical protein